jgi:uncharacterized protein (DUF4415 family)
VPVIFIYRNIRVIVYPKDHLPPHVHVIGPGFEVLGVGRDGMKYTKKSKTKASRVASRSISYAEAEENLMEALKAEPRDLKVPISVRLDGDIYLELKRLAEEGQGDGKYQALLNQILRHHLFAEKSPSVDKPRRKVI